MELKRAMLSVAAVTALAAGSTVVLTSPASAAPNTTPQKVCGSSYKTVNSAPVGSLGTVYLTYNASTGRNCVATIRSTPGTAVDTGTWIYVADTDQGAYDSGSYTSYAGPATVYGKGHCVDWGGNIKNVYVSVYGSNCAAMKEKRVTSIR
ncbi:spore-associated protein A [Streptomyces longisporoflavus]|uniref:spore-associated protein n=1 Tax=Streptomyces longisporoflavus TaxID=28044 RepID=UPI00167D5C3C|nr:spore-associated protein [Streptomyces longisporoflavus]GGV72406.1 spore-associated protein A [Streptomyces longisporoflavus]